MADKKYQLTFGLSDGNKKQVEFIAPQGEKGDSAYEIAQKNGFEGSESEWLESLHGKDGDPGKDGKTAYQYAQDGGYTGTEQEFAEKLAQDSPGGGGFVVSDDGEGNVRLELSGSVSVTDDGAGNVVIE